MDQKGNREIEEELIKKYCLIYFSKSFNFSSDFNTALINLFDFSDRNIYPKFNLFSCPKMSHVSKTCPFYVIFYPRFRDVRVFHPRFIRLFLIAYRVSN